MRRLLWLNIAVFISVLFWPQLLNEKEIVYSTLVGLVLLTLPKWRRLAVIPIIAIYVALYAHLTLTGSLSFSFISPNLPFTNVMSLKNVVDGEKHHVIVQVSTLVNHKNSGYFNAKLVSLDGQKLNYSPLVEMRWYKPTLIVQAGQLHHFIVTFKPVYGRENPAGFDRQKWRFSEHIAYQVNIKKHIKMISGDITTRARLYTKVKNLSSSLNNQGIILALSFADKTLIGNAQRQIIQQLGISHLFAISGLHIGLLFSLAYFLLHFFVTRSLPQSLLGWPSARIVNFASLSVALFYAYLAGFSLPTQRAFLMLLLAVFAFSFKRKYALTDLLTFTLFVILLIDPLAILSISLWLSFSAIAIILGLIWRFPQLNRQPKGNQIPLLAEGKKYLKFLVFIQLSLTLFMIPIQLLNFSTFNWLSPFVNFVAVPLFSLCIIPLILCACLCVFILPNVAMFLFHVADNLITYFFQFFTDWVTGYGVYSLSMAKIIILFSSLLLILFMLFHQAPNNRKISFIFAFFIAVFSVCSVLEKQQSEAKQWFVEGIDVGQGLSVLIRSNGKTLLYDTGPRYPSGFTTAGVEVVPYLQSLGIKRLDYLVISHSDIDHAGGFKVIAKAFNPRQIILGEQLSSYYGDFNWKQCKANQGWKLGLLKITTISPFTLSEINNNNSCVLRISDGYRSLLLTGDIEKKQEKILLRKQNGKLQNDIIFAPHHGSKHSSSQAFINAVSPKWVVFSAGFMNHWGFPAKEVKLRYQKQDVKMINTGLSGFVRFKIEKGHIKMQTYREDLAAYWYHHSF